MTHCSSYIFALDAILYFNRKKINLDGCFRVNKRKQPSKYAYLSSPDDLCSSRRAGMNVKLFEDRLQMPLNGIGSDEKLLSNLLVR